MTGAVLFRIKEILDLLAVPVYLALGRRPWSPGYYSVKKAGIAKGIDERVMTRTSLPAGYGIGIDERIVEYPWVFLQLPQSPGRVLDAGSALNHRFLLDRAPLKEANLTIMTLAPEKRCFWGRSISYVYGDLRDTAFRDGSFDAVVSVSTIEHIGLDNTLHYTADASKKETDALGFVPAIREFRRMLRPGGICLVTVPYGRRGVHGWYQIFDADLVRQVIEAFGPSESTVEYFGYTGQGWQRAQAADLVDAYFYDVHEGGPPDADRTAGSRGIACLRMVA